MSERRITREEIESLGYTFLSREGPVSSYSYRIGADLLCLRYSEATQSVWIDHANSENDFPATSIIQPMLILCLPELEFVLSRLVPTLMKSYSNIHEPIRSIRS